MDVAMGILRDRRGCGMRMQGERAAGGGESAQGQKITARGRRAGRGGDCDLALERIASSATLASSVAVFAAAACAAACADARRAASSSSASRAIDRLSATAASSRARCEIST